MRANLPTRHLMTKPEASLSTCRQSRYLSDAILLSRVETKTCYEMCYLQIRITAQRLFYTEAFILLPQIKKNIMDLSCTYTINSNLTCRPTYTMRDVGRPLIEGVANYGKQN